MLYGCDDVRVDDGVCGCCCRCCLGVWGHRVVNAVLTCDRLTVGVCIADVEWEDGEYCLVKSRGARWGLEPPTLRLKV